MKLAAKIRSLVIVMSVAPIVLLALLWYAIATLSEDQAEFRRVLEWNRWVGRDLVGAVATGNIPSLSPDDLHLVVILDNERRIVASSQPEQFPVGRTAPELDSTRMMSDTIGSSRLTVRIVSDHDGDLYRILYTQPDLPPPPPATDPRRIAPLAVIALLLLGGGAAAASIVRDFSRKLLSLQQATHRIATGDLSTPVDSTINDELGTLAADLERMRHAIEDNRDRRVRMLMGISHDLRTPLTTILGYAEAMQDEVFTDPQALANGLRAIATKSQLLQDRIDQLIDFVRLDADSGADRRETVNALDCFSQIAAAIRDDTLLTGRRFELEICVAPGKSILIEPPLLDRMFENLFQNAVRYTSPGDTIRFIAVDRCDANGHAIGFTVTFSDNGPGFGDLEPEQSFEPFRRGSHGRNEHGIGVGLATVRAIAESQGFTVSAENLTPVGAAITIRGPYTA